MIDQIEALGQALARLGYAFHDDGARLIVDAPEGSTASVHPTSPDYRCTFTLLADIRASVAWAEWTAKLRRDVARAWVGVTELPEREPVGVQERVSRQPWPRLGHVECVTCSGTGNGAVSDRYVECEDCPTCGGYGDAPVLPREPVFDHAYAIGPPVDNAFVMSQDEAQRGRFRVVTSWEHSGRRYAWEWSDELSQITDGPTLHWHAWGESTAFVTGVARAWAGLRGSEVKPGDPAARPVETILLRAAEGERLPGGIVALDFRGLPARTVHAVIEALVSRVRSSEGYRVGVICLCDDRAAAWVARTIELDVSV